MTPFRVTGIFLLLLLSFSMAQVRLSGAFQTSVYSFERPDVVKQGNFYQALRLKILSQQYPEFSLNTYFRVAKPGKADWNERVYNLYADLRNSDRTLQLRVGRQFLYNGVINGTLDAVTLSFQPAKQLKVGVMAGLEAPFSREMRLVGGDSSAIGGFVSYTPSRRLGADVSLFRRKRDNLTIWNLVGLGLHGEVFRNLYYQAQFDHNLESDEWQGARTRLSYYYDQWTLSGEYNFQRPRVWEDSYFRIFRQTEYQQVRSGISYNFDPVQVGVQYLFTDNAFDQTNQVVLNVGNRWGLLGFVYMSGYAGDNLGVYGDVRYQLLPSLAVKLYSSYNNYQRYLIDISEDAVAVSGGLDFRPWPYLSLQADVQESKNAYYDNDLRGLFRMYYMFNR